MFFPFEFFLRSLKIYFGEKKLILALDYRLFVCLFVYVDAREIQIETASPQKKVSLVWDFAYIQNNLNVFYTH